jgi:uncharacterized protein with HEPN domain
MNRDDAVRIRHMLEAAKEASGILSNKKRCDLDQDRILALAFIRLIEIIGEAATKVSADCRDQNPQIPWTIIIAMRNKLIHGYFDVENEILWQTLVEDIPPLIEAQDWSSLFLQRWPIHTR